MRSTQINHVNHVPSDSEETCAHDWEEERRRAKDFYDDGTVTWFWRAHTIITLLIFAAILMYVALFEETNPDPDYNTKRGIFACLFAFILFGCTHLPDGPFCRPHPALWRFLLMLGIVYELALVFLLFQNVNEARQLLKQFDSSLGRPLPEKDYGGNCRLYDHENPQDPYHNIWDKMDGFVVVHFFGWWLKALSMSLSTACIMHFYCFTLILRDYWLCMVISIMFEILEYTLEHQLPNFSECWWDHWIMDALVCNGLGIYLGMKTLNYLSLKPYHWRGMWNIPSVRGKVFRIMRQFTPYCWTDFDWRPISSLKRWVLMLGLIGIFLLAELNTFYLKFVLWIPPPHFLCLGRLALFLFWGAAAMRETFEYLDNPNCKTLGTQAWVILSIIITELLITLKFDWETITTPLPRHIQFVWILLTVCIIIWTTWHFYLQRLLRHTEKKIENGESPRDIQGEQHRIQNGNYLKSVRPRKTLKNH